ncbi:MAG: 3-oxoacyl-[acyl-carrier-protein] synthase III C-terminal domain-containing protein [Candidatus Binatia bacterium]|jgi:3-oxoacyl-[acyl-carrier-protein] synthase III
MASAILGLGHHLPAEVECAGVRRPIAVEPVGPSALAVPAATQALQQAALTPDAVDFIIFATTTPDVTFPGSGCWFQRQLGFGTTPALDIRAQCAGFVFGLSIADQFLRAGVYERVLVIGAEVHSSGLDYSERGAPIARLFGDGAGVVLVGNDARAGIRSAVIHADGRYYDHFWCEYPSSRQHPVRMTVENFRQGKHFPAIDFESVQRFAEASLPAVIQESLQAADTGVKDVDRFIICHLLPEVTETAAKKIGIPSSRLNIPAARHGHLAAAALPVALSEEVSSGRLGAGATVCLAASGSGFAWGAAVVTL